MSHMRLLAVLALLTLSLASAGVAAARPGNGNGNGNGGRPQQTRVTWSAPRIEQSVAAGETAQVTVTFTSSADLSNVTLSAPGGLGRILQASPASFASVRAGQANTVTLTIRQPAEGAHCQGGVLKVAAGGKNVPASLKVKVTVPGEPGCAS